MATSDLICAECGQEFTVENGVTTHVAEEGGVDHDADENHAAIDSDEYDEMSL